MNYVFASKTNRAFYQTVLVAAVALVAVFFLSLKAYQANLSYFNLIIHKVESLCNCTSMAQFLSMHPAIFGTIIVIGVGILGFVVHLLYKLARSISLTKEYAEHYLSFAEAGHSLKLKEAIRALDLDESRVVEINKPEVVVFCFGVWRPKICISRSLVNSLDKDELKAVLAHEQHHMISREPLKLFIVKYFRSVFFFVPAVRDYSKKYITLSELAADERAGESAEDRAHLAGAILKISQQEEDRRLNNHLSLSYFSPAMTERANRLSDETYVPKFNFLNKNLIKGSLVSASILLLIFVILSNSTKAFEMHGINGCVSENMSLPVSPSLETSEAHSKSAEDKQLELLYGSASYQGFCSVARYETEQNPFAKETNCWGE